MTASTEPKRDDADQLESGPDTVQPVVSQTDGAAGNLKEGLDGVELDDAARFLANAEHFGPLTPEKEKKLRRKIDFILLPIVSRICNATLKYPWHSC